mgnify:CR=1 FL=1
MEQGLRIDYPGGHMVIYMDTFFPADTGRLKKLLKLIDRMAKEPVYLRNMIREHVWERIHEIDEEMPTLAKQYSDTNQQYLDWMRIVEDGKYSNGLPLTKQELEWARVRRDQYRLSASVLKKKFRTCTAAKKKLEINRKILEEVTG